MDTNKTRFRLLNTDRSRSARIRLAAVGTLAVAATGLGVLLPTGVAAAAPRLSDQVSDVPSSQTYHYTGSTVSIPVPAGVQGMRFTAIGGSGGEGGGSSVSPGMGAEISGGVLVKGGDYDIEALEETRLVRSWGGQARAIAFVDGYSTSALLARVRGSAG